MTVGDCTDGSAALPQAPARADHSRFVQRVRRRYQSYLELLPPGDPRRDAQLDTLARLQAGGLDLASALRVDLSLT